MLVSGGPAPVAAPAGSADEQHAHARLPQDPERLPFAGVELGILVDHLTVGRDAQELAPARPSVVLHLGPQAVRRGRAVQAEPRVTARRGELVETIAEAPGRASAERREGGSRPGVFDARIHRGSVTSRAWILQGNRLRLRSGRAEPRPARVEPSLEEDI